MFARPNTSSSADLCKTSNALRLHGPQKQVHCRIPVTRDGALCQRLKAHLSLINCCQCCCSIRRWNGNRGDPDPDSQVKSTQNRSHIASPSFVIFTISHLAGLYKYHRNADDKCQLASLKSGKQILSTRHRIFLPKMRGLLVSCKILEIKIEPCGKNNSC